MIEVVGVRFRKAGKIYYFDPKGKKFALNTKVIVKTVRGVEIGRIVAENKEVSEESCFLPLSPVLRAATPEDVKKERENISKEAEALKLCEEKVKIRNPEMSLVDAEYTFDNSKIIFTFVADGRVDFRELLKDLASVFHTRIELRQIGARDETRLIGGLGACGRRICCSDFLSDFTPVSVRMAKDQSLSANPQKISGACGKLICCLNYEQKAYEDAYKYLPRVGQTVTTEDGTGVVSEVNVPSERIKVRFDNEGQYVFRIYGKDEVKFDKRKASEEKTEDENEEFSE